MTEQVSLGGRYEIGEVLGRGGMAEVHLGRDVRLGRQVAVKMLRSDLARDPSFQARFRREAQSSAALNHPSIVAVYDTGEASVDGAAVPYIVMEYVDGSTLRDLLNSGRRLLPERALEIMAGILDALDYSHRHGIVHRDIKPANVMLTRSGDIKVMDFGIARAVADAGATMTQTSAVIGTAQYLSPEQARGHQVDSRSDLYSAGCLFYELLTGRPPFVGESPLSVAYQHVREEPQPPSALDPDISPAIDAIVMKALRKDREERYQTAGEMRADIERALAGQPVDAPAPAPMTQRMAPVAAPIATPPGGYSTAEHRPGRNTGAYLLLALGILLVFLLAFFLGRTWLFGDKTADQVQVPKVVGMKLQDAVASLQTTGLKQGDVTNRNSTTAEGTVITQTPTEGKLVTPSSAVNLVVSAGPETTKVPKLVGLSQAEAFAALQKAQLQLGNTPEKDSTEKAGTVLAASLKEGSTAPIGATIELTVASGMVKVPDVTRKSVSDARDELQQAGLTYTTQPRPDAQADPDTVLQQTPSPGERASLGSSITLVVATAPAPTPSASTPDSSGSPSASPSPSGTGGQ